MLVNIASRHPISPNKRTADGSDAWDGKVYHFEGRPDNVEDVVQFMEAKTGLKMDRRPTHSRLIDGVVYCFPKRRVVGVHCLWLKPTDPKNDDGWDE